MSEHLLLEQACMDETRRRSKHIILTIKYAPTTVAALLYFKIHNCASEILVEILA